MNASTINELLNDYGTVYITDKVYKALPKKMKSKLSRYVTDVRGYNNGKIYDKVSSKMKHVKGKVKIELTNKETNKVHKFNTLSKASLFMGHTKTYISQHMSDFRNVNKYENKEWNWKVLI